MTKEQPTSQALPKSCFRVNLTGSIIYFQEVLGLETKKQIIEYRAGNSTTFSAIKMPGLATVSNVTLKKGVTTADNVFWSWFNQTEMNYIKPIQLIIELLDQNGKVVMSWTLNNAWPTKVQGTELKSDNNEIALETIELAYESLTATTNQ